MSSLVKSAYKTVASGLKYHAMPHRLLKSADDYIARYGDLSKVSFDYEDSKCAKTVKEALEVLKEGIEFRKSVDKLFDEFFHFQQHEEPMLSSLIRGYVLPTVAASTVGFVVAETAYEKQLKEEYLGKLSALERKLSAKNAK